VEVAQVVLVVPALVEQVLLDLHTHLHMEFKVYFLEVVVVQEIKDLMVMAVMVVEVMGELTK
jgi:hypothetical protein